jgi:hypothetical protein
MLNDDTPAVAPAAEAVQKAPAKRGRAAGTKTAKKGVVDSGRGRRGRAPAAKGKKGIREL